MHAMQSVDSRAADSGEGAAQESSDAEPAPEAISGRLKVAVVFSLSSPLVIVALWCVVQWCVRLNPGVAAAIPWSTASRIYDALFVLLSVGYCATTAWCGVRKHWPLFWRMLGLALPVLWLTYWSWFVLLVVAMLVFPSSVNPPL